MKRFLPVALYLGLAAILGHVAFITLEGVGDKNLLTTWIKMLVVLGTAYWLLTGSDLARRYRGPDWQWIVFGVIGAIGTLLVLTQLGNWIAVPVFALLLPLAVTGVLKLLPLMQFALLILLLMTANDLRGADARRQ